MVGGRKPGNHARHHSGKSSQSAIRHFDFVEPVTHMNLERHGPGRSRTRARHYQAKVPKVPNGTLTLASDPIAQLDRASAYGAEGCRFKSYWGRFFYPQLTPAFLFDGRNRSEFRKISPFLCRSLRSHAPSWCLI